MKRLGVLAAGCGALAATAALGSPAANAQTASFVATIVYVSHDTLDNTQARLACDDQEEPVVSTTNCHIYVMNTDGSGRSLTSGPANDVDPAVSPDGKQIAFARAVGGPAGQYDIYVMDANGGNVRQLTTEPRDDRYPAWRPDGTLIAYRGYPAVGGAAIFKMNPDGTGQDAIKNTGGGDQPSWSPDGTRIAYSGTYPNGVDAAGTPIIADDIHVVDADGATPPVRVTNNPQTTDRYPSWQPILGSSQLMYRRAANASNKGKELWRVDASGGAVSNFTVAETNSVGRAASWSPDGKSAAFVSFGNGEGDLEIWIAGVDLATNSFVGARQLTRNSLTDDEPKVAYVPAPLAPVPPGTTPGTGGGTTSGGTTGGGTTGGGTAVVGKVSDAGTTITVGGGTLPSGKKALSLALTVPKQNLARKKTLLTYARCNAKCTVNVTGSTRMKVGAKNKTLPLFRLKKTINANARTRLKLRIPTKTLIGVRSALRRHKQVKFSISATARTSAGEFTPAAIRTLTLRR